MIKKKVYAVMDANWTTEDSDYFPQETLHSLYSKPEFAYRACLKENITWFASKQLNMYQQVQSSDSLVGALIDLDLKASDMGYDGFESGYDENDTDWIFPSKEDFEKHILLEFIDNLPDYDKPFYVKELYIRK